MQEAEHRAAHAAAAQSEADVEERHRSWALQAERSHRDHTDVLKSELSAALSQPRALPGQPCQGCMLHASQIAQLQRRNAELTANLTGCAAERDMLESDYAQQTLQIANDLDSATQPTAMIHATKAAVDAEKATLTQPLTVTDDEQRLRRSPGCNMIFS